MKAVLILLAFGLASISALPRPVKQFPGRIVGGVEATRGEFPWMVEIRQNGAHYCGGTIVNNNWIVTAAQCSTASISGYTVVVGEHDLGSTEGSEQTRTVSRIVMHPSYDADTIANDVAVWRMNSPFTYTQHVQAADIPSPGFAPAQNVVAAGWGDLQEGGSPSNVLMKVSLPLVNIETCRASYGSNIRDGMICAGMAGFDSCAGDAGGPLISGESTLVGIVSWGEGCGRPNYPGVYSEVAYFSNWIRSTAN